MKTDSSYDGENITWREFGQLASGKSINDLVSKRQLRLSDQVVDSIPTATGVT